MPFDLTLYCSYSGLNIIKLFLELWPYIWGDKVHRKYVSNALSKQG